MKTYHITTTIFTQCLCDLATAHRIPIPKRHWHLAQVVFHYTSHLAFRHLADPAIDNVEELLAVLAPVTPHGAGGKRRWSPVTKSPEEWSSLEHLVEQLNLDAEDRAKVFG